MQQFLLSRDDPLGNFNNFNSWLKVQAESVQVRIRVQCLAVFCFFFQVGCWVCTKQSFKSSLLHREQHICDGRMMKRLLPAHSSDGRMKLTRCRTQSNAIKQPRRSRLSETWSLVFRFTEDVIPTALHSASTHLEKITTPTSEWRLWLPSSIQRNLSHEDDWKTFALWAPVPMDIGLSHQQLDWKSQLLYSSSEPPPPSFTMTALQVIERTVL